MKSDNASSLASRNEIVNSLARELVGPAPAGEELELVLPLRFKDFEEARGPFCEMGTRQEILQRNGPTRRYGLAVLYPFRGPDDEIPLEDAGESGRGLVFTGDEAGNETPEEIEIERTKLDKAAEAISRKIESSKDDLPATDFDLSLTSSYKPSSIGISFLARFSSGSTMAVDCSGGRYRPIPVEIGDRELTWWLRQPVEVSAKFASEAVKVPTSSSITSDEHVLSNCDGLDLRIEAYSRPYGEDPDVRLITVCIVNRTPAGTSVDASSIFQVTLEASVLASSGEACILPYPDLSDRPLDPEELELALLYRKNETFAVGHGCSATWDHSSRRAGQVRAECFPKHEVPSITPDVRDPDGGAIEIPMAALAGLQGEGRGLDHLERLIGSYEGWIQAREIEAEELDSQFHVAASRNLDRCRKCVERMRSGLSYLQNTEQAYEAFKLANKAVLLQQVHERRQPRLPSYDEDRHLWLFSKAEYEPDLHNPPVGRGTWRAFQIAFILMCLESAAEGDSQDREIVELIWFPTGGGKTEAYLGLAAFSMFMRRLRDPHDAGTHVLMRYTLRLLTTQQFQRASRLVCSMDQIREESKAQLGSTPFSIGIWLGSSSTPNKREEALKILRGLQKPNQPGENKLVLNQCPWCGAWMGPVGKEITTPNNVPRVLGYSQVGTTVKFRCPDRQCSFNGGLPVYVIDEDIYDVRPSIVVGTVDKFALLAWEPRAKSIFGLDPDGARFCSAPGLIIQDELHLISGPLGSMVGLYESVIEELCIDRREGSGIRPKIVSSTATIRRYQEQIRALYGRNRVVLFPPPGLEIGDSFFGKYATDSSGNLLPGKLYAGVHAPGLGSMQTVQVRSITALLQAPISVPEEDRDPWWTLMIFFNSLRELGTTLSLLQSDIPDYQKAILNRTMDGYSARRSFWNIKELTGRASHEDIPNAIRELEVEYPRKDVRPVDVCLASSILEVGVDIDRLSLMMIVGQPKTTSQYIQVTGRIGRKWWERPGLVVTLYSASKPRDRSHYEKFRSYHERLYARVEPTSVTPFSPPALDRALHGVMVAYARQAGTSATSESPYPFPEDLVEDLRKILIPRVQSVSPSEVENFERVFKRRASQWKSWKHVKWQGSWSDEDIPLLRAPWDFATPDVEIASWETPMSMRTVDAECVAEIIMPGLLEGSAGDA